MIVTKACVVCGTTFDSEHRNGRTCCGPVCAQQRRLEARWSARPSRCRRCTSEISGKTKHELCRPCYRSARRRGEISTSSRSCECSSSCVRTVFARGLCYPAYKRWRFARKQILATTCAFPRRPRISARPIHEEILMRRRWGHTDQQIAIAFGLSDRSSAAITRLLRKDTIRQADAEDIADALGLHVEMLWPDEVAA